MDTITRLTEIAGQFNLLDYILLIILIFFVVRGILRGGAIVILGSIGFILGLWLGLVFYIPFGKIISEVLPSWKHTGVLAFLIIFFMTWFIVGAVGHWLSRILRKSGLGILDRVLGVLVGIIIALIIQALVVTACALFLPRGHAVVKESTLARYSLQGVALLYSCLPEGVKEELENRRQVLQGYWGKRSKGSENTGNSGDRSKI